MVGSSNLENEIVCFSDSSSLNNARTRTEVKQNSGLLLLTHPFFLSSLQFFLPHMFKKNETQPMDGEDLKAFWLVTDMFTFDNVGFTNTVDSIKYLICADCEIGPIGWHNISDKKAFYVAVERVKHE